MRFNCAVLLCILATVAANMDMDNDLSMLGSSDMDMDESMDESMAASGSNAGTKSESDASDSAESLIPVPHRLSHHHGVPILQTHLKPEERVFWENYSTETYFNTPLNRRGALFVHVAAYAGSYVFLYPFVLIFANLHHWLYLPALTVHTALIVLSAINYWVFMGSIKELYPHNAFGPMTAILFIGAIFHWVVAALAVVYRYLNEEDFDYLELEDDHLVGLPALTLRDLHQSFELEDLLEPDGHLKTSNGLMLASRPPRLLWLLRFPAVTRVAQYCGKVAVAALGLLNWALFTYFLVYLPTAVATYLVYGLDLTMFNLLAHFIKGGVFFVLGLVSLARYCGAFRNKGWAWNHRFVGARRANSGWLRWQPSGLWTMEFIESSLILFYGSTNIFMEHLAGAGGAWTAKDLQHVSIAFIYIGCGLCGVLVEYRLSTWRHQKAVEHLAAATDAKTAAAVVKATPGYSPNLFPILTIYWTGIIMSKHEQASQLSTDIHIQWGNMFVIGCAFRLLTYCFCAWAPANKSLTLPLSPMTELVASFSLLCGGLVFMESCDPIVHLFEYYGYTLMFTLNVSVGVVALLMSWEFVVFTVKDAMVRRMARSKSTHI